MLQGFQLGGSQISVGQTTINNIDGDDYDIKKKMSLVFLGTMAAESKIEEERLKLSENIEFYPEIAFNFLKTFSKRVKETQKVQSFFDFSSSPNDVMEYNQLNSYKSGFIPYVELLALLDFYSIQCTDKVLECIIKYYDTVGYTNGLCYEAFLKMTVPQSVPQARMKVIKRKVIYETQSTPHQLAQGSTMGSTKGGRGAVPPQNIIQSIVLILDLESNLITFTEKVKVKLINNSQQFSIVNLFEIMDSDKKGYLDFTSLFNFIKKTNNQMVPNQFLGLLRRMKKPEVQETISFQDFKDFLLPILPYFTPVNPSQSDSVQHYHEINRSLDHSQAQIMAQSVSIRNPNASLLQSQAVAVSSRNPYENANQKVFFKDKHGRIVEKNHPHEPVFIKENPHFSEMLKQNINIVHHPNEDNVYTLIPEQYFDLAPIVGKAPAAAHTPLPLQPPLQQSNIISTKNYQLNYTDYVLPKVDPKDMSGIDPFFQRSTVRNYQTEGTATRKNGIFDSAPGQRPAASPGTAQPQPQAGQLDVDLSKINDINAKRIIQQQQEIIKQYQEQIQNAQKQAMPQYGTQSIQSQQIVGPVGSNSVSGVGGAQMQQSVLAAQINRPQQVPLTQQYQELYNQNPFVQDVVQLRHMNTASYDPTEIFNTNSVANMRNTNVMQDSYNAKINPHNHNALLPNKLRQSQKIIGSAPNVNNSVIIETMPFSTYQMQKSNVLNPILMKAKSKFPNKKKIFDPHVEAVQNAQLNDQHFRFSNINPYYQ